MSSTWNWSTFLLRGGGIVALLGGLIVAWQWFPTRPPQDWSTIHLFELDSEECEALRETRVMTGWLAPSSLAAPVRVAEVARKFRLEEALVCQANEFDDETCSAKTLVPGEGHLKLPLYREAPPPRLPQLKP